MGAGTEVRDEWKTRIPIKLVATLNAYTRRGISFDPQTLL